MLSIRRYCTGQSREGWVLACEQAQSRPRVGPLSQRVGSGIQVLRVARARRGANAASTLGINALRRCARQPPQPRRIFRSARCARNYRGGL